MTKFVKKELNKPNNRYFVQRLNNHAMNLRQNNNINLQLPLCRTERAKRFIKYHGAKIWNSLPDNLKQIRNPVTFKIRMKKYHLNLYR